MAYEVIHLEAAYGGVLGYLFRGSRAIVSAFAPVYMFCLLSSHLGLNDSCVKTGT